MRDSIIQIILNLLLTSHCFSPAGRGGASIFGKQFEDELHPELKFTGNTVRKESM